MSVKRKEDGPLERTRFRSDRIVEDGGRWYFLTREGSVEGPFDCRLKVIQRLDLYITGLEILKVSKQSELEYS